MASNILNQDGAHHFKYLTTGAVTNGALIIAGSMPMIALESATGSGQTITCLVGCEALVAKKAEASSNWVAGGKVYYKTTGGNKITGIAAASKMVGYGTAITATGATSGRVRLRTDPMITASG
jgi:predicted RecA/RadA family phage recombinase